MLTQKKRIVSSCFTQDKLIFWMLSSYIFKYYYTIYYLCYYTIQYIISTRWVQDRKRTSSLFLSRTNILTNTRTNYRHADVLLTAPTSVFTPVIYYTWWDIIIIIMINFIIREIIIYNLFNFITYTWFENITM